MPSSTGNTNVYSRIDLGKRKYGGPLTTEQVEDVKTFFQILVILVAIVFIMDITQGQLIIQSSRLVQHQGTTTLNFVKK